MSIFTKTKVPKVKRSTFNFSHTAKLTSELGWLVPVFWDYFEPNCDIRVKTEKMIRMAPMLAPIMDQVNVYEYWFAIPIRQLMEQKSFEDFFTAGTDGNIIFNVPKIIVNSGIASASHDFNPFDAPLADYLGYTPNNSQLGAEDCSLDVWPFLAYQWLWNCYFRDKNITDDFPMEEFFINGKKYMSDTDRLLFQMRNRCWTKDYYTSALPWAQRGGDMNMPFDVVTEMAFNHNTNPSIIRTLYNRFYPTDDSSGEWDSGGGIDQLYGVETDTPEGGVSPTNLDKEYYARMHGQGLLENGNVQIDVSPHTSAISRVVGTINQFRQAFSAQRWRELMATGGSRYVEQMNAMFNQRSSDARFMRPIFLGGSRSPIAISEVLQTSETTETSAQGLPAGRGICLDKSGYIRHHSEEHEIVMCLQCVMPKGSYYQGIPRKCNIRDKFDFPWPTFAHLGEQEVYTKELYCNCTDGTAYDEVFGYQSRYAQYKYQPNRVHGEFRKSLDFWHMARKFEDSPVLSREFLECDGSLDALNRVFAYMGDSDIYSSADHHLWQQLAFDMKVKRPLPYFGTPNL